MAIKAGKASQAKVRQITEPPKSETTKTSSVKPRSFAKTKPRQAQFVISSHFRLQAPQEERREPPEAKVGQGRAGQGRQGKTGLGRAGQPGQGKAKKEKAREDITGQDKGSQRQEKTRQGKVKEGREDQDKTRQVTSREMVPRKGDATLHVATNSQKVFRNR